MFRKIICESPVLLRKVTCKVNALYSLCHGEHVYPLRFSSLRSIANINLNETHEKSARKDGCNITVESATEILRNLPPEEERRLKVLQVEADVWLSSGHRVPDDITDEMWLTLLTEHKSSNSRRKIYKYWFKNEKMKMKDDLAKKERAIKHNERKMKNLELKRTGEYVEKNTYLQFIRDVTMNQLYYNNIVYSSMHGNTLIFDMGFEDSMSKKEKSLLVKQMSISHGSNKIAKEPFHFHVCNLNPESEMTRLLSEKIPGWNRIPYTNSAEHYLDLYPKEKLVYLTPNSRTSLDRFDPNDIYILGGIVDLGVDDALTFAQARKEKLRTAKLPLDKYLQ